MHTHTHVYEHHIHVDIIWRARFIGNFTFAKDCLPQQSSHEIARVSGVVRQSFSDANGFNFPEYQLVAQGFIFMGE